MNKLTLAFFIILGFLSNSAYAITIDGDLKDWIAQPNHSAGDWTPISSGVFYTVEDQSGLENNGYLNPGYGGQAYDAEAIYVTRDAVNLYIAIVTGLAPNTTSYPAGDIALDFGSNGSFDYGVIVKSDSQHTNPDSDLNGGIGNQGQIYRVNQWNVGLWDDNGNDVGNGHGTDKNPTTVKAGTLLPGLATIVYEQARYNGSSVNNILGAYAGRHYLIEASLPLNLFTAAELAQTLAVQWTMACANDVISVNDPLPTVPTPAVLPMLALGILALRHYRNKSQVH